MTIAALVAFSAPATICIDPGHPSEVGRGTSGKKTTELEVAWQIGTELRTVLQKRGYRVVFTKKRIDQLVKNRERAEVANRARADLMVRLHCDGAAGSGFTVYYPSKQGHARGIRGPSSQVIRASGHAAGRFHAAMAKVLKGKLRDNGVKGDEKTVVGARQGALTGSISSKVPVLLVEMVVLTNPRDEALITSPSGRKAMVAGLAAGVDAALAGARR